MRSVGFPRSDTRGSTRSTNLNRINTRASAAQAAIPIGFRTLSIQVEETHHSLASVARRKARKEPGAADADYFASMNTHLITAKEICDQQNVHPENGLDEEAAATRLSRDGPNVLVAKRPSLLLKLFKYTFGGFCSILWM